MLHLCVGILTKGTALRNMLHLCVGILTKGAAFHLSIFDEGPA
jgi:hypothetical protein